MTEHPIDGVYLSGWEYNRLLQDSPFEPRVSALPARLLWTGSHQLWLFRHVYVTKESLENERAAKETLGWATGEIFDRLVKRGTVKVVDWERLAPPLATDLESTHAALRQEYRGKIRPALENGEDSLLHDAKARLLAPFLQHLHCLSSGVPNSLSNWITPANAADPDPVTRAAQALSVLANPIVGGLNMCRSPQNAVSQEELQKQKIVEATIERPMIPELLAGEGPYSGPRGFEPYQSKLTKHRDAYVPLNRSLLSDWKDRESQLFRLQDVAERYLWPSLHGEWIPELLDNPAAAKNFTRQVQRALLIRPIANLLTDKPTRLVIGGLTAAAAWADLHFMYGTNDLIEVFLSGAAGAAAAGGTALLGGRAARLGVFYQQAAAAGIPVMRPRQ